LRNNPTNEDLQASNFEIKVFESPDHEQ